MRWLLVCEMCDVVCNCECRYADTRKRILMTAEGITVDRCCSVCDHVVGKGYEDDLWGGKLDDMREEETEVDE